jgi:hypothetical protein
LILDEDLRRWLQNLPSVTVNPTTQSLNEGGSND